LERLTCSENLDLDDLEARADTLPGPHVWRWGTGDVFYCLVCQISFEFGADPVPQGPCEPDPDIVGEFLLDGIPLDGIPLDEFIRRYGRAEAERRLAEAGLVSRGE
jgi:hypothetical protein